MRLVTKVSLGMAAVAAATAIAALPAGILYTERRLAGLPPELRSAAERQIELNAWEDFDGAAELALLGGAAVAGATLLGVLLARRIVRPLRDAATVAHRVADGDLAARARVPRRTDEVATLVRDLNTMAGALERLDRDRTIATAAIAHELRSPLTVLAARLQAADDGLLVVDSDELARLRRQVDSLSRLVDDVRTLSLGTAGFLTLEPAPVDLDELIERVVDDGAWPASLVRHERTGGTVRAIVDASLVTRVITNLVDNAARHTRAEGTVAVRATRQTDGTASIVVANDGPPIPEDLLDSLFEPFVRADPSRSRATGGSGLGLTIVRIVARAHGGDARIHNGPDGPRVEVTLPDAAFDAHRSWPPGAP